MTTKVTIEPAGHHVLVTVTEAGYPPGTKYAEYDVVLQPAFKYADNKQVPTGQGTMFVYCTTSRTVTVVDLDPDDARVLAEAQKNNKPT